MSFMQGPGSPKAEAPQVTGFWSSRLRDCAKRYKVQPRECMTEILPAAGPSTQLLVFAWADVQVFIEQGPQCCLTLTPRFVVRQVPAGWSTQGIDTDRHTDIHKPHSCYLRLLKRML